VVAAELVARFASDRMKQELLEQVVAGEIVISIGGTGGFVSLSDKDHTLSTEPSADGWTVNGDVSFVSHGASADYHLLGLRENGAQSLYLVKASDAVSVTPMRTNDPAQRLCKLHFKDAVAIRFEGLDAESLAQVALRAIAASAAEQAGATRAIFEITMEYLRTRYQFGRAIGSFQAMKHMAADLLVEVESATSAALAAAKALDGNAPDAKKFVSLAAFTCKDAFRTVSAQAIQMHGGIAYTEEHIAHLYWRRARAGIPQYGSSDYHREQYLTAREAV
jgi:alkylation response protein AidB-like acyl-CoA dehydrogenase